MRISRLLVAITVLSASLNPAFSPTPAAAQQAPSAGASLPCSNSVNIVRISDIKPGMMAKFMQAVAAQQTWYKNAGMPDQIGVMRVMQRDATAKAWTTSETEVITTHIIPPGGAPSPAHDAAWNAFVAMFSESSSIKTQYMGCMTSM